MTAAQAAPKPRRDLWVLEAAQDPTAAAQYVATVSSIFDITLHDDGAGFHNRLEAYHLGAALFGRCVGVGQTFTRSRSHITRDGMDGVQVLLALTGGWSGAYDGRFSDRTLGQIRIIDMSRPFETETAAFETLNLMLPRDALPSCAGRDIHGQVLDDASPSARLLGDYMISLWSVAPSLSVSEGVASAQALASLVDGAICAHAPATLTRRRPLERTLLAMAKARVDAEVGGAGLTPEDIRSDLGVSRSTLYRLFEPDGGVSAFIQSRRLARAFLALADPAERRSIADVAYANGFVSASHFNRTFRAEFGVRPGELRGLRGKGAAPPAAAGDDPVAILAWLRGL